jgi:glycerophosphoryl diester phosphodiesterase
MMTSMLFALAALTLPGADDQPATRIVGHRGLLRHAPENTLAGFGACADLRVGFELDVRRSRDGHLVVLHDDNVKRTTDGKGKVADLTLAELKKLDAGARFDPAFAGQRVPALDEVFALLKERRAPAVLVAVDLKIDEDLPKDLAALARKHGVVGQLVCIGLTIEDESLRKRLKQSDAKLPLARLARTPDDIPAAVADPTADWVYVRFIPTAEQAARVHRAGKRLFLAGVMVSGREPENWKKARASGVDALLTDYPLDCRDTWRSAEKP